MTVAHETDALPGANLDLARMPGHWLLARMGKRVLRPGGRELTQQMLAALALRPDDRVVELAPGLGATARLTLAHGPAAYTGIERDEAAVGYLQRRLRGPNQRCIRATAQQTGLAANSATVMYGEAMLTMQTATQKAVIVAEALRVLEPGGRYGIHELALTPDDLAEPTKQTIAHDLSQAIHVGARPLTLAEWRRLLEASGFDVETEATAPMHLLEPWRIIQDEGVLGAMRLAANIATTPAARRRVIEMRRVFRTYMRDMCAVMLVARKRRV